MCSANNYMYGTTKNIKVTSFGVTYKLPISVFTNAFKYELSCVENFNHVIEPKIDGVDIKGSIIRNEQVGAPIIIYFMHCIAIDKMIIPKEYKTLSPRSFMFVLVSRLAVISWCDDMIKSSTEYDAYKQSTIDYIKFIVTIVRCLFVTDSNLVGGFAKRVSIIKERIFEFNLPDYFGKWILMPAPSSGIKKAIHSLSSNGDEYVYETVAGKISSSNVNIYDCNSTNNLGITNKQIVTMQDRMLNDILRYEIRINCAKKNDWFKIDNFGAECTKMVHSLFSNPKDLLVLCEDQPKMTICDVFQYGLTDALEANYED